ncbi:MAG: endonuclease/exonuclease/phosphatase family protein, partial [Myxococcota bacterium]|nr:endonuclease/exonuclease/phosphatase family protein [Myxococcota bacterium]
RETPERMRAIGAQLGPLGADLIALQEIWTASSRTILLRAAKAAGFPHTWHRPQSFGGSGLLLLSRWPIRQAVFTPFQAAGLPQRIHHGDFWGGKGFVCATVETPAGSLLWVATHLHAGYVEPGEPDEYVGVRAAQIIEIACALQEVHQPVVLVGDLNFREEEPEHALLGGLTALQDAAVLTGSRSPTLPSGGPYRRETEAAQRIDYLMVRSGARHSLDVDRVEPVLNSPPPAPSRAQGYSDHVGLLAEVMLGSAPAAAPQSLPDKNAVIDQAWEQLALGREHAQIRKRREVLVAGGCALLGIGLSFGATSADTDGFRLIFLGAAGIAFLAAGLWSALCGWGAFREARGNRRAEAQLMTLKTSSNSRDTFRAP